MVKLKDWTISAIKIISGCLGVSVIITFVANYFIRSTTPEGISEGIVFTWVKDTFFETPPFFDNEKNDLEILDSQRDFPGLSAILRVEKTNIPQIKDHGDGIQKLDYWKVPHGFYICFYGHNFSEIPFPEGAGYMKTVLRGYRTTQDIWILEEDFTNGIPETVVAYMEDDPSTLAQGKIVYQRDSE